MGTRALQTSNILAPRILRVQKHFSARMEELPATSRLKIHSPAEYLQRRARNMVKLALWGLSNGNNLGTQTAKNAEIYQWNMGIQQALPGQVVSRSTTLQTEAPYLPWAGTDNRNFIPSSLRSTETSDQLNSLVNNPFQSLFAGPGAIFNVPSSRYSDAQLPLLNLQRPYPQFDGSFNGYKLIGANSWYNALQVVFQKRGGKYLNFEGNYTWSKNMDDSSAGNNNLIGTLWVEWNSLPQELDHLKREWSVSANDATNRDRRRCHFPATHWSRLPGWRQYESRVGCNHRRLADHRAGNLPKRDSL